jgi:predicted nucleic acid-binding protein
VFLDTSGLYALLVRTEERHTDVVRTFRSVLDDGRTLWTTSYVVVETTALLQHRIGLAPVRDFIEHVLPVMSVEYVSDALHRRAVGRLIREDRRRLSLVDCVSFEFMLERGLRDAFTLDEQFQEAGFRLLPPARPAV